MVITCQWIIPLTYFKLTVRFLRKKIKVHRKEVIYFTVGTKCATDFTLHQPCDSLLASPHGSNAWFVISFKARSQEQFFIFS